MSPDSDLVVGVDSAEAGLRSAILAYVGARKDTMDCVAAVLLRDPECALALCLSGYLFMHQGTGLGRKLAADMYSRARAIGPGRATDHFHIRALQSWIARDLSGALDNWRWALLESPKDILALRLAQFMSSYLGDVHGTCQCVAGVFPAWCSGMPGYGFVLGSYAYGLEETGEYEQAERLGRQAVEINRSDLWAAHAVAHVMEMQGRPQEGIDWIMSLHTHWHGCNNFVAHLEWHRCLFYLSLGQFDLALEFYDREVWGNSAHEYLDIVNAASLLWRLEQAGVGVGRRWDEVAERARAYAEEHAFVLADLHYLLALAARGSADDFLKSCSQFAQETCGSEAVVMGRVGLPVARAIIAHRKQLYKEATDSLLPVFDNMELIGGSHAQRDVFEQLLIDSAILSDQLQLAKFLLLERTSSRPRDMWTWKQLARVGEALSDKNISALANLRLTLINKENRRGLQ